MDFESRFFHKGANDEMQEVSYNMKHPRTDYNTTSAATAGDTVKVQISQATPHFLRLLDFSMTPDEWFSLLTLGKYSIQD